MDVFEQSLELHAKARGKIEIHSKVKVESKEDLSLAYSPGVAEPCRALLLMKTTYTLTQVKETWSLLLLTVLLY